MARTAIQKLRDVLFGSEHNGYKSVQNPVRPCTTAEAQEAIGHTLVAGVANTDNCIMRADGTAGKMQKSLATVDDNGSVNIPTGQTYKVNNAVIFPVISSGTAAPSTAPGKIGDIYVKTDTGKIYVAKGTTDGNDWVIVN